jgi:formyltetrahydrofolate hydrolase
VRRYILTRSCRHRGRGHEPDRGSRIADRGGSVLEAGFRWHLVDRILLNGSKTVVFS